MLYVNIELILLDMFHYNILARNTLSKDLRSYSLTISESTPAAKIRPSGSKAATGLPFTCINPSMKRHMKIIYKFSCFHVIISNHFCDFFCNKLMVILSTWQLGDLRSHNLSVLSNDPDTKVSSIGDMCRVITLQKHTCMWGKEFTKWCK